MSVTFSRIFAVVAVVLLGACAGCSDEHNPALAGPVDQPLPTEAPFSTGKISGQVSVRFVGDARVVELRDERGSVYRIEGRLASVLASVGEGDVVAWGTFDASPGFVVHRFQVTGMHGRSALDGVLEMTADGFGVRLADGTLREVPGLTLRCAKYVGARVWVTGGDDFDVVFGLIADV